MTPSSSLREHGARTIAAGSSSFAAAAQLFAPATRESTVMLYAWCRHCDDAIDGQQLGHGQRDGTRAEGAAGAEQLAALENATRQACAGRSAGAAEPAFEGLAEVVRRHALPPGLPLEHLAGFRMDVQGARYRTLADTLLYCYRVAGTVGLMMARVMGVRDAATLDRACDLGIAFQLTNIARDVVEDAAIDRVYLPAQWLADAGVPDGAVAAPEHRAAVAQVAARLLDAADHYYFSALGGIGRLPLRSAWSVATARGVYREIGREVRRRGAHAWDARVSTSRADKLWFAARGGAVALAARMLSFEPRGDLWQRPRGVA